MYVCMYVYKMGLWDSKGILMANLDNTSIHRLLIYIATYITC